MVVMTLPLDGRDVVWISVRGLPVDGVPLPIHGTEDGSHQQRYRSIGHQMGPGIRLGMRGRPGMAYVAVSGILSSEKSVE